MKKIAIGSDHAGYSLKAFLMEKLIQYGLEIEDYGTYSEESVDYPDIIHPLAHAIEHGETERGIILCGTGIGVSMVANKYPHIRAALCWVPEIAELARKHNDANVLALPGRFLANEPAWEIVKTFLETPFEGGRHTRRVNKIAPTTN